MKNGSDILLAILAGGAIGLGIGMLYAPRKGTETRRKIAEGTREAKALLQQRVRALEEEAINYYLHNKQSWDVHLLSLLSRLSGSNTQDLITSLEQKLSVIREVSKKFRTKETIIDVTATTVTE